MKSLAARWCEGRLHRALADGNGLPLRMDFSCLMVALTISYRGSTTRRQNIAIQSSKYAPVMFPFASACSIVGTSRPVVGLSRHWLVRLVAKTDCHAKRCIIKDGDLRLSIRLECKNSRLASLYIIRLMPTALLVISQPKPGTLESTEGADRIT